MKVKVKGGSGTLELADATFGAAFNGPLVHQVVTAQLADLRSRLDRIEQLLLRHHA